jgi:hypothetical protein
MASTVGQQIGRKMDRAATELRRSQRTAVVGGLTELKRGVERRLPASKRLRGVGKRGARIGVRYDLQGENAGTLKATGPMQLIERDTKAHVVAPKKRRARGGRAAVRLADGQFRGAVQHPGTKGQHPFEKGIDASKDRALKAMANPISDAVKRGLRG